MLIRHKREENELGLAEGGDHVMQEGKEGRVGLWGVREKEGEGTEKVERAHTSRIND